MRRRLGPRQAALIVRRGFGRLALKHPLQQFSPLRCTLLKRWILAVDFVHSIASQPDSIEHQTSGSTLLKSWVLPVDFVHSIASQAEGIEHQTMDGMFKMWIPRYKVSDK